MLKLYNTLSHQVEEFEPLTLPKATMYTCGPTVYDFTHIGHLKKYIGDDVLKRVLMGNGLEVQHVMNITDVGHLTSDADAGDDKLEKGAKERNMTVWDVAKFYTDYFLKAILKVNIYPADVICKATDHIKAQIKLIEQLQKKGFTYTTDEAVYFDVTKFKDYTKLSGQKIEEKNVGNRDEVRVDPKKKHPQDFALWFFTVGHFKDHSMRWPSPWGEGFPGWHIECSAMSMEYLGPTLDIHTGGIDHIPVHHTNEIAQSEAATGKPFVRFWVHHEFLNIDKEKMSKSLKNFIRLDDIEQKGFDPLALRYLILTTHYRSQLSFSWESLEAAQNALNKLRHEVRDWEVMKGEYTNEYYELFLKHASDDLKIPQAIATMWEMVNSDLPSFHKADQLLKMEKILGLKLDEYIGKKIEIPSNIQKLLQQRENARNSGDFEKSDSLRKEIKKLGYEIEDSSSGQKVKKSD